MWDEIVIGNKAKTLGSATGIDVKGFGNSHISHNSESFWITLSVACNVNIGFWIAKDTDEGNAIQYAIDSGDCYNLEGFLWSIACIHNPNLILTKVKLAVELARKDGNRQAKAELRTWLGI